ncbi:glycosyltransferase involved in cell wall biosynthesis [Asanoa ferruginea]|uniref:Glycosyltransferase involved in cell wall biosynthesis n=1 Tax=Asanoa ferruginea TaxID=53367 RepID=A0A3D9ZRM5_9ACTN|nr:glycosyltransferase family 4 protein [Asanoa ferruginea]REF99539.1 glycosyltransferase involved in cell wall biosynthesis [Asanoa ferruginea]
MLVDNGVHGDSRVQKVARSAADAGWEVVLLGKSPAGPETWQIGAAEVRLLPMPDPLLRASALRRLAHRLLKRPTATSKNVAAAAAPAAKPRGARSIAVAAARRAYQPYDRARTRFWTRVSGDAAWRRLEPALWDYEEVFGPVVDQLEPDLIHAHDFRMVGVGARAKTRAAAAGREVKLVWDAHEFLPGIKPRRDDAHWLPAHLAHEREYARFADAVVTVSGGLAELLRVEHGLASLPTVVLNAPLAAGSEGVGPDLRGLCGVGVGVPLVVYSGAAAVQRGLDLMVEALPRLGGVHVALVVNAPSDGYVRGLVARAEVLGVGGRLHVLPYVAHDRVVGLLSGADVGVIPIHRWPNHEIALITKFFEYAHARLPMVVSDVRTMADAVRAAGIGEVFRSEDLDDFVRAVGLVLADRGRYRAAYEDPELLDSWTWERQAAVLDDLYRDLLPDLAPARGGAS